MSLSSHAQLLRSFKAGRDSWFIQLLYCLLIYRATWTMVPEKEHSRYCGVMVVWSEQHGCSHELAAWSSPLECVIVIV